MGWGRGGFLKRSPTLLEILDDFSRGIPTKMGECCLVGGGSEGLFVVRETVA